MLHSKNNFIIKLYLNKKLITIIINEKIIINTIKNIFEKNIYINLYIYIYIIFHLNYGYGISIILNIISFNLHFISPLIFIESSSFIIKVLPFVLLLSLYVKQLFSSE